MGGFASSRSGRLKAAYDGDIYTMERPACFSFHAMLFRCTYLNSKFVLIKNKKQNSKTLYKYRSSN